MKRNGKWLLLVALLALTGCRGTQEKESDIGTVAKTNETVRNAAESDAAVEMIQEYDVQEGENFSVSFDGIPD